jgi:hypothetical protein
MGYYIRRDFTYKEKISQFTNVEDGFKLSQSRCRFAHPVVFFNHSE